MPNYTYVCDQCDLKIELFSYIRDYQEEVECSCGSMARRSYDDDMLTITSSVKKADSELKTIGDLANRNRDRMSEDQIQTLNDKHNSYKDATPKKDLPKGMSRMKKNKDKIKWTK